MVEKKERHQIQEKTFITVQGVRFEQGIREEIITRSIANLSHVVPLSFANNDLSHFEHVALASTAVATIDPLIPYSILSGKKSAEQLSSIRGRTATLYGKYVMDTLTHQCIMGGKTGGRIGLDIKDSMRKKFLEQAKPLRINQADGSNIMKIFCIFEKCKVDAQTGKVLFPNLKAIQNAIDGKDITLSEKMTSQIKLKEWLISETQDHKFFIDQNGWRVEINHSHSFGI